MLHHQEKHNCIGHIQMFSFLKNGMSVLLLQLTIDTAVVFPDTGVA